MLKQIRPHPNLVNNWSRKTQARVGWMIMDIVENMPKRSKEVNITGIVQLSKKYHIGDKTFVKYLKRNIFDTPDRENYKKTFHLSENDIILAKEIMYLQERYQGLDAGQKSLIRCLIAKLGRML